MTHMGTAQLIIRSGSCYGTLTATMINGIKRGRFRLHPEGPARLSEGCITVISPFAFDSLRRYIRSHPAALPVPGSTLRAYGTVEVR
ncbi:tlde1 domain-containing protein [Paraburkholderia mimosarum]|uniref:tlde1 domain-containing protein n=1 Tax=Paraburkholderia mimosarum TaxID=312026 RepID=UPI0039C23220